MAKSAASSLEWIEAELLKLESEGPLRFLRVNAGASAPEMNLDGRPVIQFSSNDYLGLASHKDVAGAAIQALRDFGAGSGAARLVSGTQAPHATLERELAEFKGSGAALVYATGSMANLGLLPALASEGDLILLDKLDHATIYDGACLSGAEIGRFPHQDLKRLRALLQKPARRKLVVVEAVYSMEGDLAPLPELLALAEEFGATLVVDEAHSTGVLGAGGRGLLEHWRMAWHPNLVLVGTLSKALGSLGGFVAGPRFLIAWLVNRSRAFIFATAPPAAQAAAASAALKIIASEPQRLQRLWKNREQLVSGLQALGWDCGASASPIVPLIVGTATRALELQARLWDGGFYAPAIRPPTASLQAPAAYG